MSPYRRLRRGFAGPWPVLALACALPAAVVSLVIERPLAGSTAVLALGCGLLLVPMLPRSTWSPSIVIAALPGLSVGGFVVVAVSLSTAGVTLTRFSVALFVLAAAIVELAASLRSGAAGEQREPRSWHWRLEGPVLLALAGVAVLSAALSHLVIRGFPPLGIDWGHYLLYAEAVREHGRLDLVNPYWMGGSLKFADDVGGGALLGSLGRFDGLSDASLSQVIAVLFVLAPLSTFAVVAGLWGRAAGLVAALTLAVAHQLRDVLPWYGLSLTFALVVYPFVLLVLGRAYRGHRDWATKCLLAFVLVATAAIHRASVVLVAVVLVTVFLLRLRPALASDEAHPVASGRLHGPLRRLRRDTVVVVLVDGAVIAAVGGSLVLVHLARQALDLGRPPGAKYFLSRLDLEVVVHAYGRWLIVLALLSLVVVLRRRNRPADPALRAVGALTVGIVAASLLWMIGISWDYARGAYYLALPLAALIGVAATYLPRYAWLAVCVPLLFVGLRPLGNGPEGQNWRNVGETEVTALRALASEVHQGGGAKTPAIVADICNAFLVPYFVHARTYGALVQWQTVAGKDLAPASDAWAMLRGGRNGARLARELGVEYAVINPQNCRNAPGLRGRVLFSNRRLRIIRLGPAATTD